MGKPGVPHRHFSDEFKMGVVEDFLLGSSSPSSLCKKYSIDPSGLRRWIRTFAPEYEFPVDLMKKQASENEQIRELKHQLRQKELELKREKMRADFYETMVEVAEEQLGIPIRKKAGTKQ